MILHVTRDIFTRTTTLSTLAIEYDGAMAYGRVLGTNYDAWGPNGLRGAILPFGFVCEDEDRGLDSADPASLTAKVRRETAIPVGRYAIRRTWSPKYQRRVMEVCDVPAFQGIRIHSGTDEGDTEGCLLPGLKRDERRAYVMRSTVAVDWLDARVTECEARGEAVWIRIGRDAAAWAAFLAAGGVAGRAA